jgi:hypothetical protein
LADTNTQSPDCRPIGQSPHVQIRHDGRDLSAYFGAFVYHPEWIKAWLRFMTLAIETVADQVPEPWGSRLEVMLRELGGVIWIQIASAIVLLRLIIWLPFHLWRVGRERRAP